MRESISVSCSIRDSYDISMIHAFRV